MLRLLNNLMCCMLALVLCHAAQASYYTDISNAFMPDELSQLSVGEDSVPIFEIPATTPLARGVVMILSEQSPSGLNLIQAKNLAHLMSQKGWHSIVSPVPLVLTDNVQLDNESVSPTHPRADSRHTLLDYEASSQHLTLLLNALNAHSQRHQGFRILVAQGMSAAQILALGAEQKIESPNTLVTLSPYWPQASINRQIPSAMANTDFPVLDLAVPNVNEWAARTVDNRRFVASTSLKLHYRQQKIPAHISASSIGESKKSPYIQLLGGHIIGWTRYLGW